MPRTRPPYAPEFRRQMIELVRSGRTPEELARQYEPAERAGPRKGTRQRGGGLPAAAHRYEAHFGVRRHKRRGNSQSYGWLETAR